MTKTIIKNEKVELTQAREQLVEEIEGAWTNLQTSMEQLKRRHYHRLGELFIQLRMTFSKGEMGDRSFATFCRRQFPGIKDPQRKEYVAYRKQLGPVSAASVEASFPPLRQTTYPRQNAEKVHKERIQAEYGRIVDDEIDEPEVFEVPRSKRDEEAELIQDLAEKIISAGFRVLSLKLHPDKNGGSDDAQRRLNAARKLLQSALLRESLRR